MSLTRDVEGKDLTSPVCKVARLNAKQLKILIVSRIITSWMRPSGLTIFTQDASRVASPVHISSNGRTASPSCPERVFHRTSGLVSSTTPFPTPEITVYSSLPRIRSYALSETALKRLMTEYRGQRIMPDSSKVLYRPVIQDTPTVQESVEAEPEHNQPLDSLPTPAEAESDQDLLAACARGDLKTISRILDSGVPVDARDAQGNTALMVACRNCQLEAVRLLLERGADVNATNSYSRRAMDVASDWGYPSIIELLRAHGSKESDPSLF